MLNSITKNFESIFWILDIIPILNKSSCMDWVWFKQVWLYLDKDLLLFCANTMNIPLISIVIMPALNTLTYCINPPPHCPNPRSYNTRTFLFEYITQHFNIILFTLGPQCSRNISKKPLFSFCRMWVIFHCIYGKIRVFVKNSMLMLSIVDSFLIFVLNCWHNFFFLLMIFLLEYFWCCWFFTWQKL